MGYEADAERRRQVRAEWLRDEALAMPEAAWIVLADQVLDELHEALIAAHMPQR